MKTGAVAVKVRVGVARYPDGWNVVVQIGDKHSVYDPAFATEAEAEAKAREVAAALREASR